MVLFPNKTLDEKIECCLKSKDPYYYLFKMYFSFYAHINPKFFNIMYRKWKQRNLYEISYIIKNMHNMNYSLIVHNKYIKMKKMKNLRLNNEQSWIKFLNKKEEEKFENYEKKNVVNNIGLMGKNSFIIYFFHFVLFYILLIGYKYQLKPKLDTFMAQNSVTEKMDTLEGSNLGENTPKVEN